MASFVPEKYEPTFAVDTIHNSMPRLDAYTMGVSDAKEWAVTDLTTLEVNDMLQDNGTPLGNYTTGLVTLPILLIIVGIVSVVILQLCLFFRLCCKCLNPAPTDEQMVDNPEKIIKSRNRAFWGFCFFMFLMLLADHLLYFPNSDLDEGKDNINLSLTLLKDIFNNIISYTNNMRVAGVNLSYKVTEIKVNPNVCGDTSGDAGAQSSLDGIISSAELVVAASDFILNLVKSLPDMIDSMIDGVTQFGGTPKTYALYALYGFILLLNLIFMFGACIASKCIMMFGLFLGEIVCIVATILCCVLMIIVTAYADFCMEPSDNLANMVPSGTGDLVSYYSTCVGSSPFTASLTESQDQIALFGTTSESGSYMSDLNTLCQAANDPNGQTVSYIATQLNSISGGLGDIDSETSCEPMYAVYNTFINKAMCTNTFNGLYKIWGAAFITSIALYGVMCFSSVMWQYFGTAWKLRPNDVHTGTHEHLTGTALSPRPEAQYEAPQGYKQEYTFTAAQPSAPTLTRKQIEMI